MGRDIFSAINPHSPSSTPPSSGSKAQRAVSSFLPIHAQRRPPPLLPRPLICHAPMPQRAPPPSFSLPSRWRHAARRLTHSPFLYTDMPQQFSSPRPLIPDPPYLGFAGVRSHVLRTRGDGDSVSRPIPRPSLPSGELNARYFPRRRRRVTPLGTPRFVPAPP